MGYNPFVKGKEKETRRKRERTEILDQEKEYPQGGLGNGGNAPMAQKLRKYSRINHEENTNETDPLELYLMSSKTHLRAQAQANIEEHVLFTIKRVILSGE